MFENTFSIDAHLGKIVSRQIHQSVPQPKHLDITTQKTPSHKSVKNERGLL